MQFIDKVTIKLKAGNGGDGIVAFKHEKYNPLGGPSGGDGGKGGSIIFKADSNKSTLLDLKYNKMIKAENGDNGIIGIIMILKTWTMMIWSGNSMMKNIGISPREAVMRSLKS